jgi:hypothetical protein
LSNIVLKDRNGIDNIYSGVQSVALRNTSGEYETYIQPNGDLSITDNGTFDVREKASVTVKVKGGTVILQEKIATPTTSAQTIRADEGYDGLSSVKVEAVTSAIDSSIKPENIVKGSEILGVRGTHPKCISVPSLEILEGTIMPDGTIAIVG